jgi:hypothetical protein
VFDRSNNWVVSEFSDKVCFSEIDSFDVHFLIGFALLLFCKDLIFILRLC